jgi:hypothetical protein
MIGFYCLSILWFGVMRRLPKALEDVAAFELHSCHASQP